MSNISMQSKHIAVSTYYVYSRILAQVNQVKKMVRGIEDKGSNPSILASV